MRLLRLLEDSFLYGIPEDNKRKRKKIKIKYIKTINKESTEGKKIAMGKREYLKDVLVETQRKIFQTSDIHTT